MPIEYEPGDIVLLARANMVAVGQGVIRLNPVIAYSTWGGSINVTHAGLAVGVAKQFGANSDKVLVNKVAHATSDFGICRSELAAYSAGELRVYRLKEEQRSYAEQAHAVALKWTEPVAGKTAGAYAAGKALLGPAFGLSSYGPQARARAIVYHAYRNTAGGPPGLKHDKKSMFCSMFVIACYQAALGDAHSARFMALDAKNTSPMKLQDYLAHASAWVSVA